MIRPSDLLASERSADLVSGRTDHGDGAHGSHGSHAGERDDDDVSFGQMLGGALASATSHATGRPAEPGHASAERATRATARDGAVGAVGQAGAAGRSPAGPSPAGPSADGRSPAGPSAARRSPAGPSAAGPSADGVEQAGPATTASASADQGAERSTTVGDAAFAADRPGGRDPARAANGARADRGAGDPARAAATALRRASARLDSVQLGSSRASVAGSNRAGAATGAASVGPNGPTPRIDDKAASGEHRTARPDAAASAELVAGVDAPTATGSTASRSAFARDASGEVNVAAPPPRAARAAEARGSTAAAQGPTIPAAGADRAAHRDSAELARASPVGADPALARNAARSYRVTVGLAGAPRAPTGAASIPASPDGRTADGMTGIGMTASRLTSGERPRSAAAAARTPTDEIAVPGADARTGAQPLRAGRPASGEPLGIPFSGAATPSGTSSARPISQVSLFVPGGGVGDASFAVDPAGADVAADIVGAAAPDARSAATTNPNAATTNPNAATTNPNAATTATANPTSPAAATSAATAAPAKTAAPSEPDRAVARAATTSVRAVARAAAGGLEELARAAEMVASRTEAAPQAVPTELASKVEPERGMPELRASSADARLEALSSDAARSPVHPTGPASNQAAGAPTSSDSWSTAADRAAALAEAHAAEAARAEAGPSESGQLGHSSARITVGEGDERVSLFIAVRGESVRVEARAHSAAYADALQQSSHELASGLAERGLALGTLTADVPGDRGRQPSAGDAGQTGAGARESHAHGQPDRRGESRGPERDPDRPRPRGLRAIA